MSKETGDNTQGRRTRGAATEEGAAARHTARSFDHQGGSYAGLDALLAQMAAAISTMSAPVRVRNRCLSEARLRAAESWRWPRFAQLRSRSGARLRLLALSAAGLVAVAAASWSVFAPGGFGGFNSIARLLPGGSQSSATASAGPANDSLATSDDFVAANSADYISLPYSDPSITNGTETTIEVSVPVAQLMAWGVPAPGRGLDDVIPVDLVLGDDGLPRAVQVLPATSSTTSITEEIYP